MVSGDVDIEDLIPVEDCEKIIKEMPRMRDGQEMFCFYYPENYPNGDEIIMNTLEEQFLLLNTVYSHYFHYNGFFYDRNFCMTVSKASNIGRLSTKMVSFANISICPAIV